MFDFRYVELMNWAYWPPLKLPLDQRTIMITGPNGSGKTTFLDSLRTLLRAPRLSANRRFTDYLVGRVNTAVVKAVVTNKATETEQRPFEYKGFTDEVVTLATVMYKRSGRWDRRFFIGEGDVSLDELAKVPKSHMLSPESYTYEVNEAGLSAAILKVLALEQGQTDKLCEKSPREILDLLLDVHGDKQIIERYKRARENYHRAHLELSQLGARLAEEQAKVVTSERAANEFRRYQKLHEELQEFEEVLLPQAEYKSARNRVEEHKLAITDLSMRLGPVDRHILQLQEQLDNADANLALRRDEVDQARELKGETEKAERDLDIKLNERLNQQRQLEELLEAAAAEGASDLDVEKIFAQRAKLRHEMARLELRIEEQTRKLEPLQQDVLEFEVQKRKVYPRYVEEFIQLLDHAGIEHDLLCDIVDISERDWQLAVESILGRDRFTVLVDAADQLEARQLGEKHRYRCYVAAREPAAAMPSATKGSALEVVDLSAGGIPGWIIDNLARTCLVESVKEGMARQHAVGARNQVTVTRQGYRQDRRGGVSIAVDRFYCGRLGQTSLKDELNREINDVKSRLAGLQKELESKRAAEGKLQKSIQMQESLEKLHDARGQLKSLQSEIQELNTAHQEALGQKQQAEDKLITALDASSNFERDLTDMRQEVLSKRNAQSEHLGELKEQQEQIAELEGLMTQVTAKLDDSHLSDAALREIEDLDELTPKYYTVRRLLSEFDEIPHDGVVEVYQHHKIQYDKQRRLYEEHEQGLRKWELEFQRARAKYIEVVEHTIRFYRQNVLALAEMGGVAAEVKMPDLDQAENSLEEAELLVRFGFDGKRISNMGASSLSGGQRVVASLILLMSLATSGGVDRGGFFIIDEPFAHLSLERIDDVTRFLEKSQCQFIMTSPTTHNVNVFNAARLQLNFRIKVPGKRFAPIPTIIRR